MTHDPVAAPTTRLAPHLEPRFVFDDHEAAAAATLAGRRTRPNVLVLLFDDVGWGDFGCYGGGIAVGAPTPNIDRLARNGTLLTSCYSEPTCTPSRASLLTGRVPVRHGVLRPPMYDMPGGLEGEVTLAQLLSDAGYVTQAVGKWHLGENPASQPQHVGFDDFYGFLSVSDMYSEWRDPYFFPEIVYSEERTKWVENMHFNKCFVHATRGGDTENVEEVTIPVLSLLDERWATYSLDFIRRMADDERPWFLYHGTRGAHFDNYPHPDFLGRSPAKHPYKDTILELDAIVGRLVAALEETGQLEDTIIVVSSDNGPNDESWPDTAYTPFRSSKGSTWEGGQRVPGIVSWPGVVPADRVTDGIFSQADLFTTVLRLAGAEPPDDRYIDGVDQTSFLLGADAPSNRKYLYYWLMNMFSGVRVGEWKFLLASSTDSHGDVDRDGGLSGTYQRYTQGRFHNLYLDPTERHSYLVRKLAYVESVQEGIGQHMMSLLGSYPAKVRIASLQP
ncbi:MAG TPA: arylsulfatase, partial [Acidimicrobiales bacterium]|nr:arylsulfatase [Acidimicrobiales bacterium]